MSSRLPVRSDRSVRWRRSLRWSCAAVVLAACAPAPKVADPPSPRSLGRALPVFEPAVADRGRPSTLAQRDVPDTISLRDAVALVLLHSPDLAAYAWESRAREARVLQAGRLTNPILGVSSEDFGATSRTPGAVISQAVQPQTTFQLSQLVELGGKRMARRRLAASDRDLAAWDYESARLDVLTRATHAFIDVLYAQEMVNLTRQSAQLVREVQEAAQARVAAGMVSPVEETKAEVSVAIADVEQQRAERAFIASRARLAAQWGDSAASFRFAMGDLGEVSDPPAVSDLRARLAQNPELARWAVELAQRQAALTLERSRRVPDLALMAGYRRFGSVDVDAFVFGVELPLPIFDRNSGGTAEAASRVSKAFQEQRSAEARVAAALTVAFEALSSAHQEMTALRESVLPRSQSIFDASSEGYRLGRFSYLDVLDAQRSLIAARGQYLRAVAEHRKTVADVERLIGAPLATLKEIRDDER